MKTAKHSLIFAALMCLLSACKKDEPIDKDPEPQQPTAEICDLTLAYTEVFGGGVDNRGYTHYGYDPQHRLIYVGDSITPSISYIYNGNQLTITDLTYPPASTTVGTLNRFGSFTEAVTTRQGEPDKYTYCTYNANGMLLQKVVRQGGNTLDSILYEIVDGNIISYSAFINSTASAPAKTINTFETGKPGQYIFPEEKFFNGMPSKDFVSGFKRYKIDGNQGILYDQDYTYYFDTTGLVTGRMEYAGSVFIRASFTHNCY